MNEALQQLQLWVQARHEGQYIPVSDEPYVTHLMAVAAMAGPAAKWGYEVGLCHDLLEKTVTTPHELLEVLLNLGYPSDEAGGIVHQVVELTDVFTKAAYPQFSKATRKAKDEERLAMISPDAQTVKYADLYDNIAWMIKFEPENAAPYLDRKRELLLSMNKGDQSLHRQVLGAIALFTG
jgi:(p)ppGpp synthase/HD superfamily hydrolase